MILKTLAAAPQFLMPNMDTVIYHCQWWGHMSDPYGPCKKLLKNVAAPTLKQVSAVLVICHHSGRSLNRHWDTRNMTTILTNYPLLIQSLLQRVFLLLQKQLNEAKNFAMNPAWLCSGNLLGALISCSSKKYFKIACLLQNVSIPDRNIPMSWVVFKLNIRVFS